MEEFRDVNFLVAFTGGILSFLSPCVLPLIPGYISYITGLSISELSSYPSKKSFYLYVFTSSLLFVLGFSVLFIAMGAGAASLNKFLIRHSRFFSMIAGIIIFILGLHITGIMRIPYLYADRRIHPSFKKATPFLSFLTGFLFGFGWSPCVGPVLAAILSIAAQEESVWRGVFLLGLYSAGLGIPFILSALFINSFFTFSEFLRNHLRKVEIFTGILLMLLGIMMFFNKMVIFSKLTSLIN